LDQQIPASDFSMITKSGIILILIYILLYGINYLQSRTTTITGQRVIRDIREAVFAKIVSFPMAYYEEGKRGELMSVIVNDVNILSSSITSGIISLVSDVISITGVMITMMLLDWQFGLVLASVIPVFIIIVRIYRNRIRLSHYNLRRKMAEMNVNVEENISGIRVAQSLTAEDKSKKGFAQIAQQNLDLQMQNTSLMATMGAVVSLNNYITLGLLIGFGGYRYFIGGITLGILLAFVQFSSQFTGPVQNLANLTTMFIEAGAALLHIRKHFETPVTIQDPPQPTPLPSPFRGEIKLADVEFSYTPAPFIEHMNLEIRAGEKLGVVGETGAGKSTLINLITRLYDVKGGSVQIDGIDVRQLRQQDIRSIVAIVSQSVFLFADTIMNNIRFGRPSATDEEVIQAAIFARANTFIEHMPEKYNTRLGDQGVGLSGGQRQLLAYARMILARSKIAILDEATSNIDSYTENLIQKNMDEVLKGITVIIIAHRFATLQKVDRLILIKNGMITAQGTHQELYEKNAYYRELCNTQYSKM
jgi:ABC-type multidrug transport system fused ATPase/permease subunit